MESSDTKPPKIATGINIAIILAIIITSLNVFFWTSKVQNCLPYPQHGDESFITDRALKLLKTNDWNPHEFNYSSFPVYLAAAGISLGVLQAAGHHELYSLDAVESVGFPHYSFSSVMRPVRMGWALLSVLTLTFMGVAAWRLFGQPALLFLVPLVGGLSHWYYWLGSAYINVDTLTVFFASLTLLVIVLHAGTGCFWRTSIIPGILCGLTAAGKYNHCWIIVPALIAIAIYPGHNRIYRAILLMFSAAAAFVLVIPYCVFDVHTFVNEFAAQMYMYNESCSDRSYNVFWSHFWVYMGDVLNDYRHSALILFFLGLAYAIRTNSKGVALLSVYPLCNLVQMSFLHVHYTRNALMLIVLFGFFAALGFVPVFIVLRRIIGKFFDAQEQDIFRFGMTILATMVFAVYSLPFSRIVERYNDPPDTRVAAERWIKVNLPRGTCIISPASLGFYDEALVRDYRFVELDYDQLQPEELVKKAKEFGVAYALMPTWGTSKAEEAALVQRRMALNEEVTPLERFKGLPLGNNLYQPAFFGSPEFFAGIIPPWRGISPSLMEIKNLGVFDTYDLAFCPAWISTQPPEVQTEMKAHFDALSVSSQRIGHVELLGCDMRSDSCGQCYVRIMLRVVESPPKSYFFRLKGQPVSESGKETPTNPPVNWEFRQETCGVAWEPGMIVILSTQLPIRRGAYDFSVAFCTQLNDHELIIPLGVKEVAPAL